jgi:hypothetical protein
MTKAVVAAGVAVVLAGGGYYIAKNRASVVPAGTAGTSTPDRPTPTTPATPAGEPGRNAGESTAAVGNVRLQARAAPGDPVLGDAVFWSIYKIDPKTGQRVNVTAGSGATPTFKVPAGRYTVEASLNQGTVSAEREIVVDAGKTTETMEIILGSGQLKLGARLAAQLPLLTSGVFWSVYTTDRKTGQRKTITASASSMPILKVPAGRYTVEASMNQGRVSIAREVTVEAGKTIEHSDFVMNAGTLELRTQRGVNASGVQTGWTVEAISNSKRRSVIAFPQTTQATTLLPAGRYAVSLRNDRKVMEREVTVVAGQTTRLELPLP